MVTVVAAAPGAREVDGATAVSTISMASSRPASTSAAAPRSCSAKLLASRPSSLRSAAAWAAGPAIATCDACCAPFDALLAITWASNSDMSG
jgi:hypothetical protein